MINIQRIIYLLKKQYGTSIDLYKESNQSTNIDTGKVTVTRTKYTIKRAIVLPSKMYSDAPFSRRANLLAKESGLLNLDVRNVIIDSRDISVLPELKDYIDYRNLRYNIAEIDQIDSKTRVIGYSLIIKEAKTETLFPIRNFVINDRLILADTVDNVYGHLNFTFNDNIELSDEVIQLPIFNYFTLNDNIELSDEVIQS